jgi:acyl-CoA synthetase (AMP-forming)/AMP-acid ligase II
MATYTFADLFELMVDVVPDRPALIVGDTRRTYAELDARANALGHHLQAAGVGPGDHIGIYATNGKEWVEGMLGAYKIRAVPINVNYRYVEEELIYLFDNADVVALIALQEYGPRLANVVPKVDGLRHVIISADGSGASIEGFDSVDYEDAIAAASPAREFGPRSNDDLYLLYTGGTTGWPKGVMWRQEDVFFALCGGIDAFTGARFTRPEDLSDKARDAAALGSNGLKMFALPPLMHGAGQFASLRALTSGDTAVLIPKFDAEEVWRVVDREGVNVISCTGDAMARPLADVLERLHGELDVSSVLSFGSSAAIWSPSVKDQIARLLPNAVLTDSIGATESGMNGIRVVQSGDEVKGGGPNTTPSPGTTVLDDDTRQPLEPGSGKIGKLARSGDVPLGYYKDPEKTAATFPTIDGVRYSIPGDYATIEADGSITLLGRGSQSINTGGEKVFPEEVEGALKRHPQVFDALVVGVPDERWGERVTALVQPREGAEPTLEELVEHCRAHIAGYKVPRQLVLVAQMPRHASGKPDYPTAKETVLDAHV